MRIGIDASRAFVDNPTGTERYSYEIITRLLKLPQAKKHEFILYTRNSPPPATAGYPSLNLREGKGVSYRVIKLPFLWTQLGLAARTWTDNLDVLWVPAHTLPILRKPGLKTVVTIHGIEYEWLPAYENILQRWYLPLSTQYAVKSADKIIAVSEFTKRQLIERLSADSRKIRVIYEGCNAPSDPPLKLRGGRKGELLNKYILFIGTVQPRKNLKRLIEAFLGLENKDLNLVIAGKLGWGYQDLPIDKYPNVKFMRYVSDGERNKLLKNALAYVQPSITEGFGLPVLEAMAAGVPVISSNGGALAEVVGQAGILFDPLDVKDISHKLSLVINSHKLREELIAKGRARVKEFSWDLAAKKTYNILIEAKSST